MAINHVLVSNKISFIKKDMETNEEYIEGLKGKRAQAIAEGDRETYIKTTLELGYDIGEVPWLAQEPKEKEDLEAIVLEEKKIENTSLKVDESKSIEIMNSRSLQNIKQSSTRRKLKKLLGDLKREGYVTNYRPDMNTTELWDCYFKDRRAILNL